MYRYVCIVCMLLVLCSVSELIGDWVSECMYVYVCIVDWVSKWVIYDNVFICYCNDGSSEWVV